MRPAPALLVLALGLCAFPSVAAEKLLKNDNFTGVGTVAAPISFPEYAGAGVIVTPAPGDYPAQLIAVDIFCTPTQQGSPGDRGAYLLDVWDEGLDGGIRPPVPNMGNRYTSGVQLTASTSQFGRFTFPSPITIAQGSVFIGVREQLESAIDGTTIAMDTGPTVAGHNWYFNGGAWSAITGIGSGTPQSVDRNWIIRGVLSQPNVAPIVTSISPASGPNAGPTAVTITGDRFDATSRAFLGTVELTVTSRVPPTAIYATVPAGLQQGAYDVIVENPAVPVGLRGTLPQGYTVVDVIDAGTMPDGGGTGGGTGSDGGTNPGTDGGSSGGLRLDSVSPAEIWAGDDSELTLLGAGFEPTVQVLIGQRVATAFDRKSAAVITTTISAKTLSAGTYDLTVINPDGTRATLKDGLKVTDGVSVPSGCGCSAGADGLLASLALAGLWGRRRRRR